MNKTKCFYLSPLPQNSVVPKYHQIKQIIRGQIASDEFRSGELIPTEEELSKSFSVSKNTVVRALRELTHEGLLYRIQGKGTFVADNQRKVTKTENIGVISRFPVEQLSPHDLYSEIFAAVEEEISRWGYHLLYKTYEENFARMEFLPLMLRDKKVDGILLLGVMDNNFIRRVKEIGIPLVLVDNSLPDEEIHCVVHDEREGAKEITRYLIGLGHRKIAYISGPLSHTAFYERLEGYRSALRDAKIPLREEFISEINFKEKSGYIAMQDRFKREISFTAVFGANDGIALDAIRAIREQGLSIPEDISVVGFDDSVYVTAQCHPPLTTIRTDRNTMGKVAVSKLCDIINGRENVSLKTTLPVQLIVRDSAKKV